MKKLLLTTLAISALGVAAHAGTISLDTRTDYESNTYNEAAGQRNSNRFNIQTLRLDAKGNLSDATTFRLRYRLNNPSSSNNASTGALTYRLADSASKALDFAYIQHKLMDNLSLQLGKFNTDIGGIEGMTSGADLYFTSLAYSEQSNFRYQTGAKLIYTIEDQEIDLMSTNQEVDVTDTRPAPATGTPAPTTFSQNHQTYGIVLKGSYLDKSLQPVLSWHNDKAQAATAAGRDTENNYYAAGLKWDWAPFFVEADYLYDTFKDRTIAGETDKTTTIVGTVGGRMENLVLKLKAEHSEGEVFSGAGASDKNKFNGYQAAVEYLPYGDKTFRYHVAYVTRDFEPGSAALGTAATSVNNTDKQNTQTVLVGARILADFLK